MAPTPQQAENVRIIVQGDGYAQAYADLLRRVKEVREEHLFYDDDHGGGEECISLRDFDENLPEAKQ